MLDNEAFYGPNIASLPWSLKFISSSEIFESYNSGEAFTSNVKVGIYDQHDQLIVNDNSSKAIL